MHWEINDPWFYLKVNAEKSSNANGEEQYINTTQKEKKKKRREEQR